MKRCTLLPNLYDKVMMFKHLDCCLETEKKRKGEKKITKRKKNERKK